MRVPKVNLLNPQNEESRKKTLKTLLKISSAFIVIFFISFFIASFLLSYALPWRSEKKPSFMERMATLLPSGEQRLLGEDENRINVLLLGQGGAGHEGPYLTDTIILASLNPKEKKAALLSIPRDLIVPISDYGWRKMNHINAFAEMEKPGAGGEETRRVLSSALNIPVPYYVRIDFSGFEKIIDDLGGVIVNVDRAFIDSMYPTSDFKTKTIGFPQGPQVMNGEKALQYARSRHGNNNESTDFARSKRQQKLILAIKDKIFSIGTILSPLRLIEAMQTMKEHINTNFEVWGIVRLANMVNDLNNSSVTTYVLDDSPDGFLKAENYEGAYVLVPKQSWGDIKYFVKNIFSDATQRKIKNENLKTVKIEIQNGTKINGLAARLAEKLSRNEGLNVIYYGNAMRQDLEKTAIFNLTDKDNKEIIKKILQIIPAQVFDKSKLLKDALPIAKMQGAEILILLGSDQKMTAESIP